MKYSKEDYQPFIDKTYLELKDFQKLTVDYVYDKFYKKKRNKFLVADEVGLGKTLIAKGVIAKAFENFKPSKSNPTFNVIYICSNQALAKENLKKLNFTKQTELVKNPLNRLIYLAFKEEKDKSLLKFDSLTPATSLSISNRSGSMYERAIIFSLLTHYAPFKNKKRMTGLRWLLRGMTSTENWNKLTSEYHRYRRDYFRTETFIKFREILFETKVSENNMPRFFYYLNQRKGICLWDAMMGLCRKIDYHNHKSYSFKNEVIVNLRHLLTKVCLEYLSADLIILDEFQRYAEILGATSEDEVSTAIELAQAVFELKNTKVLMLSATPFKPYTTSLEQDSGENHYDEFQRVLKFLMKKQSVEFWAQFEKDRRDFFSKIMNPKVALADMDTAVILKNNLQKIFKDGMVRTERQKVSNDQNVLIKSIFDKPLPVTAEDVKDFIVFDRLVQKIKQKGNYRIASPIEYSKSCPFPLSFLDGYQLKKNIETLKEDDDIKKLLRELKSAWISLDQVDNYEPIGIGNENSRVPNVKMQWLIDQLNESDSWKWLWVPPTIKYYGPRKIFPQNLDFSKTLIFSSWKMVPRAVSTILSYEAERKAITAYRTFNDDTELYFADKEGGKRRKPTPILTFKMKAGTDISSAMSLFTLIYPSKYLSELYDPEKNLDQNHSLDNLVQNISEKIKTQFQELNLSRFSKKVGVSDRWYWAAPLLLDKFKLGDKTDFEGLIQTLITNDVYIDNNSYESGEEITGKNEKKHIEDLINSFKNPENIELGPLPEDLFQVLALICLSSPSICYLRSILKSFNYDFPRVFNSAYAFGISKIHFFNKPENITIVKSTSLLNSDSYWKVVLNYCMEGNIQSLLDEFIHLMKDSGYDLLEIQNFFSDILSLRTSTIKVDDSTTFIKNQTKKMRAHYAVDFGTQDLETDSGTGRVINVRQAFNSPYRPFILASTSIGQEGLDFHYYCGRVMHWNLPNNAIDIEQREGRINRYKGLIIRQNVARKYLSSTRTNGSQTLWNQLFSIAKKEEGSNKHKCELVPYWYVEPIDDIKIHRVVPIYPFSRDIQKYRSLIETLTFYRLTFGQPRQEELVETLQQAGLTDDEIERLKNNLLIDLSPSNNL